jgi:hypothetical protein
MLMKEEELEAHLRPPLGRRRDPGWESYLRILVYLVIYDSG